MIAFQSLEEIIQAHHDAFLVDILGVMNCGLSSHRIQELRDLGLLFFSDFPVLKQDPPSTAIALGRTSEKYASQVRNQALSHLLRAPLKEMAPVLQVEIQKMKAPAAETIPEHRVIDHDIHLLDVDKPAPPDDTGHHEPPRKPPNGIDGRYLEAYGDSVRRIGSYCRGLGDTWNEKFQEWIGEEWDGDVVAQTPDQGKRETKLEVIRRLVSDAWVGHKDPRRLARELEVETRDFGRDWKRIALTEMQALYNESVLLAAIERHGPNAMLAKVPESSACTDCLRLYLDADGLPIVKSAHEWLTAGNNVGKPRAQWVASLWPCHPRCCCSCQIVPPGCRVDRRGMIIRGRRV